MYQQLCGNTSHWLYSQWLRFNCKHFMSWLLCVPMGKSMENSGNSCILVLPLRRTKNVEIHILFANSWYTFCSCLLLFENKFGIIYVVFLGYPVPPSGAKQSQDKTTFFACHDCWQYLYVLRINTVDEIHLNQCNWLKGNWPTACGGRPMWPMKLVCESQSSIRSCMINLPTNIPKKYFKNIPNIY